MTVPPGVDTTIKLAGPPKGTIKFMINGRYYSLIDTVYDKQTWNAKSLAIVQMSYREFFSSYPLNFKDNIESRRQKWLILHKEINRCIFL